MHFDENQATYPKVSGYPELSWYFILHTYFEKIILNSTCFYDKNTVFFVSSSQWDVFLHFSIFHVKFFFFTIASRIIQHPEIFCAVAWGLLFDIFFKFRNFSLLYAPYVPYVCTGQINSPSYRSNSCSNILWK